MDPVLDESQSWRFGRDEKYNSKDAPESVTKMKGKHKSACFLLKSLADAVTKIITVFELQE